MTTQPGCYIGSCHTTLLPPLPPLLAPPPTRHPARSLEGTSEIADVTCDFAPVKQKPGLVIHEEWSMDGKRISNAFLCSWLTRSKERDKIQTLEFGQKGYNPQLLLLLEHDETD